LSIDSFVAPGGWFCNSTFATLQGPDFSGYSNLWLKTSRLRADRILDPKRDITLSSLQRAAALVGQLVVIELV
jgi:hypothetical protein